MPKRICILSDSPHFRPPFTIGGSVGQLLLLSDAFKALGREVYIAARTPGDLPPGAARHEDSAGVPIRYLGPGGEQKGKGWGALLPSLGFIFSALWFVIAQAGSYDYLVVSGFRLLAVPAALAAKIMRKRCIVRIEDANDLTFSLRKESSAKMGRVGTQLILTIMRLLYWSGFRLPDRVIAFSPEIAARLKEMGAPPGKVETIPNGIDSEQFRRPTLAERKELRERLRLPVDKRLFVFSGRTTRSKGVMDLIRAWILLASERPDVQLIVLGDDGGQQDGCEAEARQQLASQNLAWSVDFRGAVANVQDYLKAADAFVFLSHGETFGLSIIEALATGLPCVTTRVGVVKELEGTQGWGLVVDVGASDETVLERLRTLLAQEPNWASMGDVSQRIVADRFGIQSVAQRYLRVLEAR